MILSENEAKNLLTKVLSHSMADSITASLSGANSYNIRFARNSPSTNGFADSLSVSVTSNIGKKSGTTSTNKFDDESIRAAVRKSEDIARLSPDNKEFMPPLGNQTFSQAANYSAETENFKAEDRSGILSYVISQSLNNDVVTAGYLEDETTFTAIMTSNGLFAYNKGTASSHSATARTKDGTGSSRFEKNYVNIKDLDFKRHADFVINRSKLSMNPREIKPGRYTVILETAAASDMVSRCISFMGSRGADEGRSFFSKPGGGNLIGEALADPKVNIYSDPTDDKAPSIQFTGEGFPRGKTVWFENGMVKNLHRNRFWAEKTSAEVIPFPSNLIMQGSDKTTEQLIAETDYGILITRFWYIRTVEQKTMLLTGLTRDGIFEVKDGKISRPIKNFRFNESPINVLKNVIDMSQSEQAPGSETGNMQILVPALKVSNFNLSSLSDAI